MIGLHNLKTQAGWARLYCCLAGVLFALQGLVVLGLYSVKGFDTPPEAMPFNFQIDPLHGLLHLVTGLIATYIGFWKTDWTIRFVQVFSLFYIGLALLGTFTVWNFGLRLGSEENNFHWTIGLITAAIGFGPLLFAARPKAT